MPSKYETLPKCEKCACESCQWKPMGEIAMPVCTHGPHCVMKLKAQMEMTMIEIKVHLPNWKGFHAWTKTHSQRR